MDKLTFLKQLETTLGEANQSIRPDTQLRDLITWESVGIVSVTLMIEEQYGLILEPHELEPCLTPDDLITLIEKQTEGCASA